MGRNLRSHRGRFVRDPERAGSIDSHSAEGQNFRREQKAEIEERPTQDLDAFELYVQAKAIIDSYINATDVRAALLQALKSLDEAIQRDPNFVSAYCYAARANDLLFFFDLDPTPDRISLADAAVNAALRLRPDSAEAHFARADYLFRCLPRLRSRSGRTRDRASGSAEQHAVFYSFRLHQSPPQQFSQAERDFSTAFALDPRNPNAYNLLADTYMPATQASPDAAQVYDSVLAAGERTPIVLLRRASAIFNGTGELNRVPRGAVEKSRHGVRRWTNSGPGLMAMIDGNFAEAERVLAASPREDFQDIDYSFYYPEELGLRR